MDIGNAFLIQQIPVVIDKPGGPGGFGNLMSIPEYDVDIPVQRLPVGRQDPAQLQCGCISGGIAGDARLPGIEVGGQQEEFIALAVAP